MEIKFNVVRSYKINQRDVLNKTIFFMHVPKSGGTTIDHIFAKFLQLLKVLIFRFKHSSVNDYKKLISLNSNIEIINLSQDI